MPELTTFQRAYLIAGFAAAKHETAARFLRGEPTHGQALALRLRDARIKAEALERGEAVRLGANEPRGPGGRA